MIQDVDASVKELLVQKVPVDNAAIDIKFEMPTKDWSGGVVRPTVNVFLYDVRENQELRSNERFLIRHGNTATETRAPVRLDFSYMLTVWTADVSDEHQLLGRLLSALLRFPLLPPEVLKGVLVNQPMPVQACIAQPERTPNAWDFWGSLDNRVKVGVSYVLTAALETVAPMEVGLVTQSSLGLKDTV